MRNSCHLMSSRTHTRAARTGRDGQVLGSAWYPRSPQHADSVGVKAVVGLASRGEAVVLAGLGAGMRHGVLGGVWGLGRLGCLALGASPGGATAFRGCGLRTEFRGRLQACLTEPRPVSGAASSHLFTPRCFCRRDKRPGPETAAEPRQGNPSPSRGGSLEPPSTPAAPHGQRDQPGLGHRPAVRCPGPRGARPGRHALLPL